MSTNSRILTAFVVAYVCHVLSAAPVFGCSCGPRPPACEAVTRSQLVFVGTITNVGEEAGGALKTARMTIDRAFKGDLQETIELRDDGMCPGPTFVIGQKYLMYASGDPTKAVSAGGCTRSRPVEYAQEDFDFLNQYAAGKFTGFIAGTARLRSDEQDSELGPESQMALSGVEVTVSGTAGSFRTITDALGNYEFQRLPSGRYSITAGLPGYWLDWAPHELTFEANACARGDLFMQVDRRAQGIVRDEYGAPVERVRVEMVPAKPIRGYRPILLAVTDERGEFVIPGIPSGDYYLGINIDSVPTRKYPYAPTYYPGTSNVDQAMILTYGIGPSVRQVDLRLSGKLSLVTVQGQILREDGTPPLVQDRPQVRFTETNMIGVIEESPISVDTEGRFLFELYEGIRYGVFASAGSRQDQKYSEPTEFVPTAQNNRLELRLSRTPKEFERLSADQTRRERDRFK